MWVCVTATWKWVSFKWSIYQSPWNKTAPDWDWRRQYRCRVKQRKSTWWDGYLHYSVIEIKRCYQDPTRWGVQISCCQDIQLQKYGEEITVPTDSLQHSHVLDNMKEKCGASFFLCPSCREMCFLLERHLHGVGCQERGISMRDTISYIGPVSAKSKGVNE